MKIIYYLSAIVLLFSSCSLSPKVKLVDKNYDEVVQLFIDNCKSKKAQKMYGDLCQKASQTQDAKSFIADNFTAVQVDEKLGLLTGYYEPELRGSYTKSSVYQYPVYKTPRDLITVTLGTQYPDLKNYRLRGRIENKKLVPYYTRKELFIHDINAEVICYVSSKIELFFLEVQGSGRVVLDDGETIFVGFANQNGHPYKSIGKHLVQLGEISQKNISLQSIRAWFVKNPSRVDEILNYNPSVVFFEKREQGATGSLGIELTPMRSVAVDKRSIALGSMLYLKTSDTQYPYSRIVFAQDTGGAIKGKNRADMFLGFGINAGKIAGKLQEPLELWVFQPKKREE